MSTLSDDTLRKILLQIQTQAITSQKQLAVVRAQITSKEKERRILALQMKELGNVPGDGGMYKGVGKMFIEQPRQEINKENAEQEKQLAEDVQNLSKKAKYLEKQFDEANSQLKDIVRAFCYLLLSHKLLFCFSTVILFPSRSCGDPLGIII
ncbi:prefoldin subunit 1 [Cryptococcus neoformans var. grubii Br795]|uniref:Prefoldin subunit 1 n=1 Tax=Cryptococcus neoformans Tu259-1 TaxID=1230072 RepID=A0A854QFG0_CRYNE|nr:prefoldin subunit 1 [Cryptococcus neoformans var. grubii 125.91]OXC85526.1 prefoldin subunit 1 [Cryptococcus neoformans var. grubii AD1-7a]OXG23842.1 prefoldin subunit 1 [Cryptococcus neoformans var. grubii Tu259-1]OXG36167.1 prefoldin subunit 1 [Cryptococcus neoformans var. grubii Bt15]OXG43169.1 prefoldin subunit 1 [Cryptococcus neoformans var. grubii Bt120]OXG84026.1 prefoldin subunit 1 [Cryptococcus neoformans var. grubii MW-RSA36]OXG85221.1 prefoldin subunit 1 [Cryptococcus neoformans